MHTVCNCLLNEFLEKWCFYNTLIHNRWLYFFLFTATFLFLRLNDHVDSSFREKYNIVVSELKLTERKEKKTSFHVTFLIDILFHRDKTADFTPYVSCRDNF